MDISSIKTVTVAALPTNAKAGASWGVMCSNSGALWGSGTTAKRAVDNAIDLAADCDARLDLAECYLAHVEGMQDVEPEPFAGWPDECYAEFFEPKV
jgi:hypothetical protein